MDMGSLPTAAKNIRGRGNKKKNKNNQSTGRNTKDGMGEEELERTRRSSTYEFNATNQVWRILITSDSVEDLVA